MVIPDLLALRLHNQGLSRAGFKTPHDATAWFGAIQAQELLSSFYAIGLRVPGSTETSVEAALTGRSITRAWPMRSTLHFMAAEDALWITRLLGPRQNKRTASIYRGLGLSEAIFKKARPLLEKKLSDGPKSRDELYETLEAGGIDVSAGRGAHIFKYWGQEGVLCMGPRQGKQQTLALLETWTERKFTPADSGEALAILACRYFQSHGPATLRDFVWWTGATVTECKKALAAARPTLASEVVEGREYFFTPFKTLPRPDMAAAFLLPAFDEYTVAYADRTAVMKTEDVKKVSYGINPNIIIGGHAVGMWKRVMKGKKQVVQLQPFAPLKMRQRTAIAKAVTDFGDYTGIPTELES